MSDLKPCPFCGGEATLEEIPFSTHTSAVLVPYHSTSWTIRCVCGSGLIDESKKAVISRWNTRPKSEAEELLEWFSSGRVGSQIYKSANWECLFEADSFDEPYEGSGPTLLDALRAAREEK